MLFYLKNVLASVCRPDKFKSSNPFVQPFEFIRSTKGCQFFFQKPHALQQQRPFQRQSLVRLSPEKAHFGHEIFKNIA